MSSETKADFLDEQNHWGWANDVLYRMCREAPEHTRLDIIAGKIWLIGRAYSAAIERGASGHFEADKNFYIGRVAPMMKESDMDKWLDSVRTIERVTNDNAADALRVHHNVTALFKRIAGAEKRSLASKYLHFHQPNTFFIFDSIANTKIRELLKGQRFKVPTEFDTPYAEFVYRCLWYRDNVFEPSLGRASSPRELDQHLLGYE
jgi:hypothetical protein